jgi:hypothetical protein
MKNRMEEAVNNLNALGHKNNSDYVNLTNDEIAQLDEWRSEMCKQNKQSASYAELFAGENMYLTLKVWVLAITKYILRSGIFELLPFLLA